MAKRKRSFDKRIVVSGVLAALSVIILYLGCAIEVLDLTMSAIVSLLVVVIVIEMGYSYAWLTYAATAIISLLLLPQKTPAVFYACFMGFYPIMKSYIERIGSSILRWIVKLTIGSAALGFMFLVIKIFVPDEFEGGWLLAFTYVIGVVAFVMYDMAVTRLIGLYFARIRDRIKIYKYLR